MAVKEYYWHKYEVVEGWSDQEPDNPETIYDTKTITTDQINADLVNANLFEHNTPQINLMRGYTFDFNLKEVADYGGYKDYEIELVDEGGPRISAYNIPAVDSSFKDGKYSPPASLSFEVGSWTQNIGGILGRWGANNPTPVNLYHEREGKIEVFEIYFYEIHDARYGVSNFGDFTIAGFSGRLISRISLGTIKEIYLTRVKGALVETIIAAEGSYPLDGVSNGFWWVRGDEYTLEPPELISPEPLSEIRNGVEEFVIKIIPRQTTDPGNYHARIRLGTRSDFVDEEFIVSTVEDRTNWFYEAAGVWQPFPADGVPGNTYVKYVVPEGRKWEFGLYFWDALCYHSFWGYGPPAQFRSFILLVETDSIYKLYIDGVPYYISKLRIIEASNGRVGRINIRLINQI